MTTLRQTLYVLRETVDYQLNGIDWNPIGMTPNDIVKLIEIHGTIIRVNKKLKKLHSSNIAAQQVMENKNEQK